MRLKENGMLRKYQKANKNRSILNMFIRVMACLVVFCTTYALILPVITLEQDYTCMLQEHIHTESCYAQNGMLEENSPKLICGQIEHQHNEDCHPYKSKTQKTSPASVGAGSTATLTLDFTSWGPW